MYHEQRLVAVLGVHCLEASGCLQVCCDADLQEGLTGLRSNTSKYAIVTDSSVCHCITLVYILFTAHEVFVKQNPVIECFPTYAV